MSSALVLIDAQRNMFDPAAPAEGADLLLARLCDLLQRARSAGVPVALVRNCGGPGDPDEPGTPGFDLHPDLRVADGDLVLDKTTDDAFASTPLHPKLAACGVDHVVIAGLQSEYCVRDSVLGALRHGLRVTLVSDGHSTYPSGGRTGDAIRADVNSELAWQVALTPTQGIRFA